MAIKIIEQLIWLLLSISLIDAFGLNTIISRFDNFIKTVDNLGHPYNHIHQNNNQDKLDENFDTFDFIIIGSGSAGSIIANRLSEIPEWKILLLEAGKRQNPYTLVPAYAALFQHGDYNWNYTMEKQDGICLAMEDNICAWPRGKALGGTTVINYMIYTRGNALDYKKWIDQGNPGWSYRDVLPYYLKSENCRLSGNICSNKYHNTGGSLNVEYPFSSKITQAFLDAGVETGEEIIDYNARKPIIGYSQIQANLQNGRRHSNAAAFLDPISSTRDNLRILTSARVTKILINPATSEAIGVEYINKNGQKFVAHARKEVISSAGAFHSPQLLMLSGIGPKSHLNKLGINLVKDLPVGQLLYDHIMYIGLSFMMNETIERRETLLNPIEFGKWLHKGRGPLTSLAGIEALAYIKTKMSKEKHSHYPDVELLFSGLGSLQADYGILSATELRIRRKFYREYFEPLENIATWSAFPVLLHPKSRGYLTLRSRDPFDAPLMYGNYYTDDDDIGTMIAAIRYIIKLSRTKAFQRYNSTLYERPVPGCEQFPFDSNDYWKCAIRQLTITIHHQVGTCKMGPSSDSEAVVDNRLRVYGVKRLRVADTSVIPVTLSAHTSAPSMMVGEKAADLIKQDWGII